MTQVQKDAILRLRRDGLGYADIATALGLSVNTVKCYGRRNGVAAPDGPAARKRCCPQCGIPFQQPAGRKPKRFCSDACRMKWWHRHRDLSASARRVECPVCGRSFTARRGQTYCGRSCYVKARFGDHPRVRKSRPESQNSVVIASPVVRSAAFLPKRFSGKTG